VTSEPQSAEPMAEMPVPTAPSATPPAKEPGTRPAKSARVLGAEDRPLTRGERAFYQFARLVLVVFARLYWRATTEGMENIPKDGPFVLCPVHRSNIDTPLMCYLTRRQLRYMAKDTLWKHGWSARLLTALGGFPVNRETADREALRTCEAALRRGEPVVIFPEGTRKSGPAIVDLFEGAAFVAMRGGVPIIPVGIGGSADAMPKGSKFLRPVKIRLLIGKPIQPPPRTGAGTRGSRRQVHELTARLQTELQRLYDRAEGRTP
jgi:1-acyl-sn-glycerol-3-phosphate acyltransferase